MGILDALTPQDRSCSGVVIDCTGQLDTLGGFSVENIRGGCDDCKWKSKDRNNLYLDDPPVGGAEGSFTCNFKDGTRVRIFIGAPKMAQLGDTNTLHGLNYVRVEKSYMLRGGVANEFGANGDYMTGSKEPSKEIPPDTSMRLAECKERRSKMFICDYNRKGTALKFKVRIVDPGDRPYIVLSTQFSDFGCKTLARLLEEELKKRDFDVFNPNTNTWGEDGKLNGEPLWQVHFKRALEMAAKTGGCMLQLQGAGYNWKNALEGNLIQENGFAVQNSKNQTNESGSFAKEKGVPVLPLEAKHFDGEWQTIVEEVQKFVRANAKSSPSAGVVQKKVQTKMVQARSKAGNDSGSGASKDLHYFEYNESGWLMLGHAPGPGSAVHHQGNMLVVKEDGRMVKRANGWVQVWNDKGSGNRKDYCIWRPILKGNDNYVGIGCFCTFGSSNEPRVNAAVLHLEACERTSLGGQVWSDAGTGASNDVVLNFVPRTYTMWPSKATLKGAMAGQPVPYTIKQACM